MGNVILKQPDGKLASFSTYIDDFVMWDSTEEEAVEYCLTELDLGRKSARQKVQDGLNDLKPLTVRPGTGLTRWDGAIKTIAVVHGEKTLRERMAEMGFPDYPRLEEIIKEYARAEEREEEDVGEPTP